MQKFEIGEIVRKKDGRKDIYFVVTDVEDFSKIGEDDLPIVDINYELMLIFPIIGKDMIEVVDQDDIVSFAKDTTKDYQMFFDYIIKERYRLGLNYEPLFVKALRENKKTPQTQQTKHRDFVEYHKIETVDECLDAINDLNMLHSQFGDEAYLQLKEVVIKRIKELV